MTTFALVIELERHIEILLLGNDCVIVPGFGGFMAHHVDARYDGRDNMFLPPLRTVGFNPQLTMNDSLLAQSYVDTYDISYPEAVARIADEVAQIRQQLEKTGFFELNGIGTLSLNADGNYSFEPCEAGILTPDLYGLGGFEMQPIAAGNFGEASKEGTNVLRIAEGTASRALTSSPKLSGEGNEKSAEFIQIKKSVLRNLAAACIALIAFFALSTPLAAPDVQKSQVDTGMLTRIMPKEIVKNEETKDLQLTKEPSVAEQADDANNAIAEGEESMPEDKELKQDTPYYSIVLASRVTKRNAASYAESLQNKGFKDARVLITNNNVKVIYGSYDSEEQAYKQLNSLRNNEAFSDGWITKVQE